MSQDAMAPVTLYAVIGANNVLHVNRLFISREHAEHHLLMHFQEGDRIARVELRVAAL